MAEADLRFWFDPVCPFAWMASRWVRLVQEERGYEVEWRFISLRLLNAHLDYATHFPKGYVEGHTAGLRLLRVAARARAERGGPAVAAFYAAAGAAIFDVEPGAGPRFGEGDHALAVAALAAAGLPSSWADAVDDASFDALIQAETDGALAITGRDVGTPILQVGDGPGFFGPVISRLPEREDAVRLWEHVVGLASFPGFAELKRSLREVPQLRSFGADVGAAGAEEDWQAGARRAARPGGGG